MDQVVNFYVIVSYGYYIDVQGGFDYIFCYVGIVDYIVWGGVQQMNKGIVRFCNQSSFIVCYRVQ